MSQRLNLSRYAWFVAVVDFSIIVFSYLCSYALRNSAGLPVDGRNVHGYMDVVPWLGAAGVATFYLFSLYNMSGRNETTKYYYNLVLAQMAIAAEIVACHFVFPNFEVPGAVILIALALQTAFMMISRIVLFYLQSQYARKKTLVIVQDSELETSLIDKVLHNGGKWFDVKAVVHAEQASLLFEMSSPEIELYLLSPNINPKVRDEIIRFAGRTNKEALFVPAFQELFLLGSEPQQIDDLLVFSVASPGLSPMDRFFKRAFDLAASSAMLLLASPVMLLFWALIPLTSKGKALYSQERIGLDEKPFMVLKFRSMVDNAEQATGPVLAKDADSRVTRIGKFIRATRIDELPQLINVLKGEMSLVGPRPERDYFIRGFKQQLPYYAYRFNVKPGLTGLAQVMGNYSTLPEDKLRYDLQYMRRYSPMLDLKILLQSFVVVLLRDQAKGVATAAPAASQAMLRLNNAKAEIAAFKE